MSTSRRTRAAEAYVQSMRTGEPSAADRAAAVLAPDVRLDLASGEVTGRDAVLAHVRGFWPFTTIYTRGGWSTPEPDGDGLRVDALFPALGAAPRAAHLTFSFDADDRISRIVERLEMPAPPEPADRMSLAVRGFVNSALANGTPMVVAYTGDDGTPVLSLRGSTQVYSDTQLCIWVRNAAGGICRAVAERPGVSLLYRDSRLRTTLSIRGRAHVEDDPAVRDRVFELSPEVEQLHDPGRTGAALLIDVTEIRGTSPDGPILLQR